MKHSLLFCMLSLVLFSMQAQAKSTTKRYKELQRNAAFQNLSFIEIAAEIDDFPAISSFMTRSSYKDLQNAYVTLKEKLHQLEESLKEKPRRDVISVARKAETRSKIQRNITQLTNMMNRLTSQMQRLK